MSAAAVRGVVRRLGPTADPPTDADLVAAFVARRDHAAFAELVRRHGPTVLGACRRVLADAHAAEDAFQAVFLVLARKAAAVRPPGAVGGWLYGVAVRTANKARVAATRRRRREMIAADDRASRVRERPECSQDNDELRCVLDAELAKLPDAVRAAIVLCDLHGKTRAEAAAELGCPEGTVAARLHRGRKKLADALTRRGLALPAAGLTAVLAPASVSASLSQSAFAVVSGTASVAVRALAREVIRSMTTTTHAIALGFLTLLTGGLLAAGALLSGEPAPASGGGSPAEATPVAGAPDMPKGQPDHGGRVYSVSYSPDGKRFLSVGDGKAVVWDADSQKKLCTVNAEFAAFSGDGKNLFVLEKDEFRTLDPASGKTLATKKRVQPKPVLGGQSAAFSGNAMKWVEFDGVRHHLRTEITDDLYDLADQTSAVAFSQAIPNHGRGGAFSPDEKQFAGIHRATTDHKETACLSIWSLPGGKRDGTIYRLNQPVLAFAWSPDGKEIAVAYPDGVRVYDAKTLKESRVLDPPGRWGDTLPHTTALAWSADGKTIAAAVTAEVRKPEETADGRTLVKVIAIQVAVRLLDATTGKELRRFEGFADNLPVVSLAFRKDGQQLVCGSGFYPGDGPASNVPQPAKDAPGLRVIALDAPKPAPAAWKESKVLEQTGWLAGSVVYSADGKTLYVGGTGEHVGAYATDTWKRSWGRFDGPGRLPPAGSHFGALALAPDDKTLAVATKDGVVFLDATLGRATGTVLEEKGSAPLAVAYFADTPLADGVPPVHHVAFGNARGYFVKTWRDGRNVSTIKTSSVAAGATPADEYAVPLAVAPGERRRVVVTGPIDRDTGKNVLWAWAAGARVPNELLTGHKAVVTSAAWSKDGKLIVTGDADGVVITWDAVTFKEKSRLSLGARVAAVAVSTSGNRADDAEFGEPLGKVVRRREGVVEINLGSNAGVQPGDTFTVLPADFPEKGRQSRIRIVRVPDGVGGFKQVERFVEKAVIEVTEVIGPNMSRCRITREPDPIRDGAMAGDLIYKPLGQGTAHHVAASVVRPIPGIGQGAYAEEIFAWPAVSPPDRPEAMSRHEAGAPFTGVASLAFAPDGKSLASAFCNFTHLNRLGELRGAVRVFALEAEKPKAPPAAKHVSHVEYSPDGKRYAVVAGGKARVYDTATGQELYAAEAEAARFTADGKSLVAMAAKSVNFHETEKGQITASHNRPDLSKWEWHRIAFSPDGKRYAVDFGSRAGVYDTATGKEVAQLGQRSELVGYIVGSPAEALVFSPDGKMVAMVGALLNKNGQLSAAVWDAETGKRLHAFQGARDDGARVAAFASDGDRLAIGFKDRVEVWVVRGDAKKNPERTFRTDVPVTALAFSADGKQLAVGLRESTYDRWWADVRHAYRGKMLMLDATTGEELRSLGGFKRDSILIDGKEVKEETPDPRWGHSGFWVDPLVTALAFAPDGKKLLAGTGFPPIDGIPAGIPKAGEVKVFDLTAPPEKLGAAVEQKWTDAAILTDHGRLVNGVAVAPDGKTFAAATDGNVTCWDSATRKVLWKTKLADAPFHALAFSADSKSLFAAGKTEVIRLDAATGEKGKLFGNATAVAVENATREIKDIRTRVLAVSSDGKRLAGSDGYATWALELDTRELSGSLIFAGSTPKDAQPAPAGVAWSADGKLLAVITPKQAKRTVPSGVAADTHWPVQLWTVGGKGFFNGLFGHDKPVTAVAWSKDGKLVASGGEDGLVILWDAATGKELWRHAFKGRDATIGRVNALAISPTDNTVAVAVSMGSGKGPERVVLLDPKGGKDVGRVMRWSIPVASVAWSPDGKFLITGCGAAGRAIEQDEPPVGEVVVWERKP